MKKIIILLYSLLLINSSLHSLTLETNEIKLSSYWGETDCNNGLSNLDTTVTSYDGASSDCPLYFGGNASDYSSYTTDLFNQKISTSCYQGGSLWSFEYNFVTKRECKGYDPTCTELEYIDRTSIPYICKTKPVCNLDTEYYNTVENRCIAIPTCADGKYWSREYEYCRDVPSCTYSNEIFNKLLETCGCSVGFTKDGLDCVSDIDNDGIKDTLDSDIDGDGIPNNQDSTPMGDNSGVGQDSTCYGQDFSTITFFGLIYPFNTANYNFYGKTNLSDMCSHQIFDPNTDSSALLLDINPACEDEYCYTHSVQKDCYVNYLNHVPAGYVRYDFFKDLNDRQCSDAVTGYPYIDSNYKVPNPDCPDVTFCFLKLADEAPDANTTTADLNSTLQMLNELKTGNAKLTDLNTKTKGTNTRLDTLNKTTLDILGANNDIKSKLNTILNNDKTSSDKLISESKLTNVALGVSNSKLTGLNDTMQSVNGNIRANGSSLSNIAANSRAINNNLINMTGKLDDLQDSIDGNISLDTSEYNDFDTLLTDQKTFFDKWKNEFTTFGENVTLQLENIDAQYINARDIFETENTFTADSGTTDCFSFNIWGRSISFDLCSSLSVFSPIVYFVVTLIFMVGTFKFMVNHLLRGLE